MLIYIHIKENNCNEVLRIKLQVKSHQLYTQITEPGCLLDFQGFFKNSYATERLWKFASQNSYLIISHSLVFQDRSALTKLEHINGGAFFEKLYHEPFHLNFSIFPKHLWTVSSGYRIHWVHTSHLTFCTMFSKFMMYLNVTNSLVVMDFFFIFQFKILPETFSCSPLI